MTNKPTKLMRIRNHPSSSGTNALSGTKDTTTVFSSAGTGDFAISPTKQRERRKQNLKMPHIASNPDSGLNPPPKHPMVSASPIPTTHAGNLGSINRFYQNVNQAPGSTTSKGLFRQRAELEIPQNDGPEKSLSSTSTSHTDRPSSRSSSRRQDDRSSSTSKRENPMPRNTRRLSQMLQSSIPLDHTDFDSLLQIFKQDTSFYLTLQQSFHKLKQNFHDSRREVTQLMEELLKLKYELSVQKRCVENVLTINHSATNARAAVGTVPRTVQDEHFLDLRKDISDMNTKVNQSDKSSRKTYQKLLTKIQNLEQHVTKNDTVFREELRQLTMNRTSLSGRVETPNQGHISHGDGESDATWDVSNFDALVSRLGDLENEVMQLQAPRSEDNSSTNLLSRVELLERMLTEQKEVQIQSDSTALLNRMMELEQRVSELQNSSRETPTYAPSDTHVKLMYRIDDLERIVTRLKGAPRVEYVSQMVTRIDAMEQNMLKMVQSDSPGEIATDNTDLRDQLQSLAQIVEGHKRSIQDEMSMLRKQVNESQAEQRSDVATASEVSAHKELFMRLKEEMRTMQESLRTLTASTSIPQHVNEHVDLNALLEEHNCMSKGV